VGIVGIGGLGTLAVQFAKAMGHTVVAVDNRAEGRELATAFSLKADLVVNPDEDDAVEKIKQWAGRDGLAAVIVCTDHVGITKWSLTTLRPHGVAVPLGLPVEGFSFDAFALIFNEITIKGSLVSNRWQAEDMMAAVARHGIKSHLNVVTMKDGPKLPELYMDQHLKGRLVMKIE
jgi:D-arabinose 1-dehydrogenase-like Zn-dependent alcohol dehydrogenase